MSFQSEYKDKDSVAASIWQSFGKDVEKVSRFLAVCSVLRGSDVMLAQEDWEELEMRFPGGKSCCDELSDECLIHFGAMGHRFFLQRFDKDVACFNQECCMLFKNFLN